MAEYDPTFIDNDGNEVHIGDTVSWLTDSGSNTVKTKSAPVEGVNYKLTADGDIKAMAKLRNRTQVMAVEKLTLIDGSTLKGILRRLVADANGYLDESTYEHYESAIDALYTNADEGTSDEGAEVPTTEGGEG